jgi:hypothetical protein
VFTWLDSIRAWLLPFLYGLAAVFCLLLVGLVFWRAGEGVVAWRRRQLEARYRPVVGALFVPASQSAAMSRVTGTPRSHRALLGTLLLGALRPTTGAVMPRVVEAVWALGLPEQWIHDLADRRWWVRAAAVRALGFIHDTKNVDRVIGALDDPHEEVRTAAVDALGRIGDARAVPALIARLKDETRHQRARVVDALRLLGPPVVAPLIREAEAHPEHTPSINACSSGAERQTRTCEQPPPELSGQSALTIAASTTHCAAWRTWTPPCARCPHARWAAADAPWRRHISVRAWRTTGPSLPMPPAGSDDSEPQAVRSSR